MMSFLEWTDPTRRGSYRFLSKSVTQSADLKQAYNANSSIFKILF